MVLISGAHVRTLHSAKESKKSAIIREEVISMKSTFYRFIREGPNEREASSLKKFIIMLRTLVSNFNTLCVFCVKPFSSCVGVESTYIYVYTY